VYVRRGKEKKTIRAVELSPVSTTGSGVLSLEREQKKEETCKHKFHAKEKIRHEIPYREGEGSESGLGGGARLALV